MDGLHHWGDNNGSGSGSQSFKLRAGQPVRISHSDDTLLCRITSCTKTKGYPLLGASDSMVSPRLAPRDPLGR